MSSAAAAATVPLFVTLPRPEAIAMRWSPSAGRSTTSSPAASATVPLGAAIAPRLVTERPISTTSPLPAAMAPRLVTSPSDAPRK
ncbi:MAG: hypothetical protein WDN03_07960 [Rhizomicrobium sp.]